jgi:hypothetical protein
MPLRVPLITVTGLSIAPLYLNHPTGIFRQGPDSPVRAVPLRHGAFVGQADADAIGIFDRLFHGDDEGHQPERIKEAIVAEERGFATQVRRNLHILLRRELLYSRGD